MTRPRFAGVAAIAGLALALACPVQVAAQAVKPPPAGQDAKNAARPADPAPAAEPPPPPYQPDLLKLAEIMGTLAYLRDLCGDNDGAEWRKRMAALINAEGKTERRKEELAGAFNRGFRGYALTYRSCTAAANVVIGRYLEEGSRLAREITSRYGG